MTKDLTTLTDTELSAWLGEVLQQEKKHREAPDPTKGSLDTVCAKCGKTLSVFRIPAERITKAFYEPCTIPDPIPLDDWNVAMKWRDWAVAEYGLNAFLKELEILCIMCDTFPASDVYAGVCQPRHYQIAAATLKEQDNGK